MVNYSTDMQSYLTLESRIPSVAVNVDPGEMNSEIKKGVSRSYYITHREKFARYNGFDNFLSNGSFNKKSVNETVSTCNHYWPTRTCHL